MASSIEMGLDAIRKSVGVIAIKNNSVSKRDVAYDGIIYFNLLYTQFKNKSPARLAILDKYSILDKVQPGDQIWMWRENVYKKFAHVTIYVGDEDVVHIASRKLTKFTIRKQNLFSILGNSKCFIVRLTEENQNMFRGTPQERALICAEAGVTFDFTFSRDNCEAFSNYMYGVWDSNRATLQGKEVKIEDRGKARKLVDNVLLSRKHTSLRTAIYNTLRIKGFEAGTQIRRLRSWSL